MKNFWNKLKNLLPSRRKWVQLYCALLFNANIKGFFNGIIYKGPIKNICTPGLNCYSCPGASGACPLGSLQNALYSSNKSTLFYMIGTLMLYGILLGRLICGWLCPFGFIQELLYKIKTPKLKKNKFTRILSGLKYVLLVFFVIIVPILYAIRNVPLPAFCKYICPAGTLEGAMGLLSNAVNEGELARLGPLFTWKFALMVSFILGSIFIFRFFCRFFCPLGAIYGLFNRFSVFGIRLDRDKCIDCGKCITTCKMDIRHVNDHECISCGDCVSVCPTRAISWKGSSIILPPSEIEGLTPDTPTEERIALTELHTERTEKINRRNKVLKIVVGAAMTLLLAFALIYYNFIDQAVTSPPPTGDEITEDMGNEIGDKCYGMTLPVFDENGFSGESFNPAKNPGKITVINFWGEWCAGCKVELPYFDRVATDYKDYVTVVAVHTEDSFDKAPGYLTSPGLDNEALYEGIIDDLASFNYIDSDIIFVKDEGTATDDKYYSLLGGTGTYPITVVLNSEGEIIEKVMADLHYDELVEIIEWAIDMDDAFYE